MQPHQKAVYCRVSRCMQAWCMYGRVWVGDDRKWMTTGCSFPRPRRRTCGSSHLSSAVETSVHAGNSVRI